MSPKKIRLMLLSTTRKLYITIANAIKLLINLLKII